MDNEIDSIKKELKCWESMFARKYGRKPSKNDIDESSAEIKDSYKRYSYLKKKQTGNICSENSVLEVNQNDVLDQDGVFGRHLNKKFIIVAPIAKVCQIKHDPEVSWRPKLKPLKRNSISEKSLSVSKDEKENHKIEDALVENVCIDPDHVLPAIKLLPRKPMQLTNKKLSSFGRHHSKSSEDWINNCKESLENKKECDMKRSHAVNCDDIEHNNSAKSSVDELLKETKHMGKNMIERGYTIEKLCLDNHLCDNQPWKDLHNSHCNDDVVQNVIGNGSEVIEKQTLRKRERTSVDPPLDNNDVSEIALKQALGKKDTKIKRKNKKDSNEETIITKARKAKRKREEDNENDDVCKKVKLSRKAAEKGKRLVSDNFVKIDLHKKVYLRGAKKMTGGAYKRRMWKQKTNFEQPSKFGKKTCFKCGGEGHWAKFCRGKPKLVDPFSKLDDEKKSLEFQHLNEVKGSCFDHFDTKESDVSSMFSAKKVFTLNDVMEIEPCWPRTPYTMEIQEQQILPLFEPENGRPSKDTYAKVKTVLKNFGHESFREGQHEAASRIVSGLSTLLILSTGSGKSLCYQLPSYMYYKERKAMTIVVSPLVALMQDQVAGLPSCLPGAFLNSNMTKLQQQRVITKIKENKIAVLLVSPEALVSGGFSTGILPPKSALPPIAFACIDEAHCLSEWSHNFRPSYLRVCKVLRERYNIKCLLGLTATASQTTAKSVTHHLGIPSEGSVIRDPNPIPHNLHLTASRDENRDLALVELLQMKPFDECDSVIVYVTRRLEADRLAVMLRTCLPDPAPKRNEEKKEVKKKGKGKTKSTKPFWWNVECYHAGLTPAHRRRVQNQFMSGELRVVVATVAFGMGLDKSDVRSVIHYNMPKSFENYVQEIGRAGRDGKPSFCHVFLDDDGNDLNELRRHIYGNTVDRNAVKLFIDIFFPSCSCADLKKRHTEEAKEEKVAKNDGDHDNSSSSPLVLDKDTEKLLSQEFADEMCTNIEMMSVEPGSLASVKRNCDQDVSQIEVECCCSGHRRALPIDSTVLELDMPEENISTLMSYLELHPKRWIEVFNPILSSVSVKCYGGPEQFQLLAKKFPPVAVAVRQQLPKFELKYLPEMRQIDFDMVDVADTMCWDVITVAREVRSLQWNMAFALDAPLNNTGKSGIIVECGQLSFHIVTKEGVSDDEKDEICDFLHENIMKQEENRLLQLNALYNVLKDLSCQHFWQLPSNKRIDERTRSDISRYFMYDIDGQIEILKEMCSSDTTIYTPPRRWNLISGDIGNLMISHPDQKFTGRTVARILQGISSPCYPAINYGRDKRFWRQCLDVDFNELRKFAVGEITRFKS